MTLAQAVHAEAQPVHARIQLEPDVQWPPQFGGQQPVGLARVLNGDVQPQLGRAQILGWLEAAFQQQDARLGCAPANHLRLFQAGHGETIGNLAQCHYRLWRTMAIGVGLDHGEGLALGCALFGEQVVVTKRGQVDRGNQRTHGTVPVQRRVRLESYSARHDRADRNSARGMDDTLPRRRARRTTSRRRTDSCPARGSRSASTCRGRPAGWCRSGRSAACR